VLGVIILNKMVHVVIC